MVILHSPCALFLFCAALLLTGIDRFFPMENSGSSGGISRPGGLPSTLLSYLGGFFQAAGTLAALYAGAPLQEILAVTLLLLGCVSCGRKGEAS